MLCLEGNKVGPCGRVDFPIHGRDALHSDQASSETKTKDIGGLVNFVDRTISVVRRQCQRHFCCGWRVGHSLEFEDEGSWRVQVLVIALEALQ